MAGNEKFQLIAWPRASQKGHWNWSLRSKDSSSKVINTTTKETTARWGSQESTGPNIRPNSSMVGFPGE